MGGRVALVTGASKGIGAAVAGALAREGHRVAVGYSGDGDGAQGVCGDIESLGGMAQPVQLDVTDPAAVDRAFSHVESTWGKVEVLVANAGINHDGLILRMSPEQWRSVLSTNLDGVFHCIRRSLGGMVRARFGRIVAMSSVAGSMGSAGQANYAAAKAGLVGLCRSTSREVASRKITCNIVEPGPIATAMTAALPDHRRQEMADQVPLGRFGTPEEVAAVVAFLCSDIAGYVTGAVVPVDGGLSMGR